MVSTTTDTTMSRAVPPRLKEPRTLERKNQLRMMGLTATVPRKTAPARLIQKTTLAR